MFSYINSWKLLQSILKLHEKCALAKLKMDIYWKHGGKKSIKYTFKKCLSKLNYLVNRWRTEKLVHTHWTHNFFSVFTVNLFTCSRRKLITKTFLVCSTQQFVVNPYSPNQHTFLFIGLKINTGIGVAVDETRLQEKLSNVKFQALDAF